MSASRGRPNLWLSGVRLCVGIIVGLLLTSLVVEMIELGVVLLASGEPFAQLQANQDRYFAVRNQPWVLGLKMVYTVGGATLGGWAAAKIAAHFRRLAFAGLTVVQCATLIWAGFFSELAATSPSWLWIALPVLAGMGFYAGFRIANREPGG